MCIRDRATIVGQYAYVANVGDSRLYVVDKQLRQVTRDHSLVQEMVRMGEITAEEARNHPDKNIITRALGAEKTVDVDFFDMRLEPGRERETYQKAEKRRQCSWKYYCSDHRCRSSDRSDSCSGKGCRTDRR